MELSKDTWHYRNFEIWCQRSQSRRHSSLRHGRRQPDLCTYTRIVLFYAWFRRLGRFIERNQWFQNILWFLVLYGIGLALSVSIFETIGLPDWSVFLLPFVIISLMIGILIAGVFISDLVQNWNNHYDPYAEDKEPNVIAEYVKAKKRKICPMIEFKDA